MCTPSVEWVEVSLGCSRVAASLPKAGTALVGRAQSVACRIREYQEIAVETIIASADPQLEEAFYVAELLFARLGLQGEPPLKERGWDLEFGRGLVKVAASWQHRHVAGPLKTHAAVP